MGVDLGYLRALADFWSESFDWRAIERRLSTSVDARMRRLAIAALKAWAARVGDWEGAPLERLRAYRADPAPLVAAAAQFTLPAADRDS